MRLSLCILIISIFAFNRLEANAVSASSGDDGTMLVKAREYARKDSGKSRRIMERLREAGKLSPFALDLADGDVCYNAGDYYGAMRHYNAALERSEAVDDSVSMVLLYRLVRCYDRVDNDMMKTRCLERLLDKARIGRDDGMEAVALFSMGRMLYGHGDKPKGYDYMARAVGKMEQSSYKYRNDNLCYFYNTLIAMYIADRHDSRALGMLRSLSAIMTRDLDGHGGSLASWDRDESKAFHANKAVVLGRLGHVDEARRQYGLFSRMPDAGFEIDFLIMPYLLESRMYGKAMELCRSWQARLVAEGDTIGTPMVRVTEAFAQAYQGLGRYDKAIESYRRLLTLNDSIRARQLNGAALELATVYETQERDEIMRRQDREIFLRNMGIALISVVMLLLAWMLWRLFKYNRATRRKNEVMVEQIEQMLRYKERYHDKIAENMRLKEMLKDSALAGKTAGSLPSGGLDGLPSPGVQSAGSSSELQSAGASPGLPLGETPSVQQTAGASTETRPAALHAAKLCYDAARAGEDYDREFFRLLAFEIVERKMFLDPAFSRETLMTEFSIPKNKFATLFRQHSSTAFTTYINDLRLEYATRILTDSPYFTIDTVARECGMSSLQTFYRLFVQKYGMTPAEFRAARQKN